MLDLSVHFQILTERFHKKIEKILAIQLHTCKQFWEVSLYLGEWFERMLDFNVHFQISTKNLKFVGKIENFNSSTCM
jgi:hypothetical protein